MSRNLSYRVWDKQTKSYEWDREFVLSSSGELMELYSNHNGTWEYHFADTNRFIIEQGTGLKDKYGKEIHEGDILWWEHFYGMTGENIETTARVYWEENDASFVVGDWFEPLGHLVEEDEVEVISNIHEKEELLD